MVKPRRGPMWVLAFIWEKRIEHWTNGKKVMSFPNLAKARAYARKRGYAGIKIRFK